MKTRFFKKVLKLLFLFIPIGSIAGVVSCSFFNVNTQWLNKPNSNINTSYNNAAIDYASYQELKQQYKTDLSNIESNWKANFQAGKKAWNNFNVDLSDQLTYEVQQWNAINKTNNGSYLATLYPQLWSLNNALITLDWYYVNYLVVQFVSNLSKSQTKEFYFLPKLSKTSSYLFLLEKLDWNVILLNPRFIIFKHNFKTFLQSQKISTLVWSENLKVFAGTWIHNPSNEWTLSKTYNNFSPLTLGFVACNWSMMNQQIPACFADKPNANLNVNNWNYFNNTAQSPSLSASNLNSVINGYKEAIQVYDGAIKHLVFVVKTSNN